MTGGRLSERTCPGAVVLERPTEWRGDDGVVLAIGVERDECSCWLWRPSLHVFNCRRDEWTFGEMSSTWEPE